MAHLRTDCLALNLLTNMPSRMVAYVCLFVCMFVCFYVSLAVCSMLSFNTLRYEFCCLSVGKSLSSAILLLRCQLISRSSQRVIYFYTSTSKILRVHLVRY